MNLKKVISLGLTLVMLSTCAGCGGAAASSSLPAGGTTKEAVQEAEAAAGEAAEEAQADAASETEAEAAGAAAGAEIAASDISVKWEDSRVYSGTGLGNYIPIVTYEVKGYEDVPFIKASDYMNIITKGRARCSMDGGVMTVLHNGTKSVIDPDADTIMFEDPAGFRAPGDVKGAIVEQDEFDVITWSTKNKSGETEVSPYTVDLKNYHMPVIAYEDDLLLPFLALQNTFGAVQFSDEYKLAYNGKDYFNIYKAQSFALEYKGGLEAAKATPYLKAVYSGPFSEKDQTTQAYADYGYYSICLLLDLAFGHKSEKNITTFDEYFTRMNCKDVLTSTDPSAAMTAEFLLFYYMFDSSHDALLGTSSVFKAPSYMTQETVGSVLDDVKNSEEGQELFGEEKEVPAEEAPADEVPADQSEMQQSAILGMLMEKGFNIPETAPQMIWMYYMASRMPKEIGRQGIQYSGDTAVIHFNSFKDDTPDRKNSYYLEPVTEEDSETSNFAFFYNCFKELEEHDEIKNVVINVAGNGGGSAAGLVSVLGFLTEDGEVKLTNLDTLTGSYREEYYHVDTNLDGIADDEDGFGEKYDFYIMSSGNSYSCGNALPYFAQKNGLAKIIGSKPGGGDCCVGSFVDAYGRTAAFSGMLKLGTMQNGEFVSNEKDTTMDYDMMPTLFDVTSVPWFEADGIAEAVHNYQNGETAAEYSGEQGENVLTALMEMLFNGLAAIEGADFGEAAAGATAEAAAVEGGN